MGEKKAIVALVRCDSYERDEVKRAVAEAIESLGGFDYIFSAREAAGKRLEALTRDSEILLKPNLLSKASPDRAVTTHPEVFRACGELLQEAGYKNLKYGDSPGNPLQNTENISKECGLREPAEELGIPTGDFEHGREVEYPEGRIERRFILCNEVAALTDNGGTVPGGMVNLCKMKTHQLERITGAVKNTLGCVSGMNKAAFHAKHPTAETFARMLADLNGLVVPRLHIMDGIVAMEGNGPGSGDPTPMNVILASTDPVALDAAFCHLIHLDPELVPTHRECVISCVGCGNDNEIAVIVTNLPMIPDGMEMTLDEMAVKCGNKKFNVQRSPEYMGQINMMRPLLRFLQKRPVIDRSKCISCGICVDTCPVEGKAIHMKGQPAYDYRKCICCYCCQEMCPEKAIGVKKPLLARLVDRHWRI